MKSIFIAFALVFAIVSGITATVGVLHPSWRWPTVSATAVDPA